MQASREECGDDRSWIPYDAMGDFSFLSHRTEGKEEPPCEDRVREPEQGCR